MANHSETKFLWSGKEETLKPGQILTGRIALSEQTGIPESTVDDILKVMEKLGQIQQQKTTKYRVITVLKWDSFQISNNKATTKQQQSNTYKECKNDKNDNNIIYSEQDSPVKETLEEPLSGEVIDTLKEGVGKVMQTFYDLGNRGLNFGNKTNRESAKWLVNEFGLENALAKINYAMSVQRDKFAPVITTPYQLKIKLADLKNHYERDKIPVKGKAPVFKFETI